MLHYASGEIANKQSNNKSDGSWQAVRSSEMETFLALTLSQRVAQ